MNILILKLKNELSWIFISVANLIILLTNKILLQQTVSGAFIFEKNLIHYPQNYELLVSNINVTGDKESIEIYKSSLTLKKCLTEEQIFNNSIKNNVLNGIIGIKLYNKNKNDINFKRIKRDINDERNNTTRHFGKSIHLNDSNGNIKQINSILKKGNPNIDNIKYDNEHNINKLKNKSRGNRRKEKNKMKKLQTRKSKINPQYLKNGKYSLINNSISELNNKTNKMNNKRTKLYNKGKNKMNNEGGNIYNKGKNKMNSEGGKIKLINEGGKIYNKGKNKLNNEGGKMYNKGKNKINNKKGKNIRKKNEDITMKNKLKKGTKTIKPNKNLNKLIEKYIESILSKNNIRTTNKVIRKQKLKKSRKRKNIQSSTISNHVKNVAPRTENETVRKQSLDNFGEPKNSSTPGLTAHSLKKLDAVTVFVILSIVISITGCDYLIRLCYIFRHTADD